MINHIIQALKKGEAVTLTGFGTFNVSKRKARKGRNPKTGKPFRLPPKDCKVYTG